MTIPEWIITGALSLFCLIVGWGLKRLVGGHDILTEHVARATSEITKVCGQVDTTLKLQNANKDVCDERERNNRSEHDRLMARMEKFR